MIDTHLRLLREMAKRARRRLEEHDNDEPASDAVTGDRRKLLARAADRATRQVRNAEVRRHKRPKAQRS